MIVIYFSNLFVMCEFFKCVCIIFGVLSEVDLKFCVENFFFFVKLLMIYDGYYWFGFF